MDDNVAHSLQPFTWPTPSHPPLVTAADSSSSSSPAATAVPSSNLNLSLLLLQQQQLKLDFASALEQQLGLSALDAQAMADAAAHPPVTSQQDAPAAAASEEEAIAGEFSDPEEEAEFQRFLHQQLDSSQPNASGE